MSSHVLFFFFIAKAQKVEMDKLDKAKKERTKVWFRTKKNMWNILLTLLCFFCVRGQLFSHTHIFFVPYILHLTHMQKQSPAPASAAQAEPCAALTPEPVFLYHVSKWTQNKADIFAFSNYSAKHRLRQKQHAASESWRKEKKWLNVETCTRGQNILPHAALSSNSSSLDLKEHALRRRRSVVFLLTNMLVCREIEVRTGP